MHFHTQAILEWRISNTPPSDAYHHRHIKKAEDASKGDRVEVSRLDGSKVRTEGMPAMKTRRWLQHLRLRDVTIC